MTALILTPRALGDLARLTDFLREDPRAALATRDLIFTGLRILENHPFVVRVTEPPWRELVISRGKTGYIAVYEYDAPQDRALVHAIRHQRESGFEE